MKEFIPGRSGKFKSTKINENAFPEVCRSFNHLKSMKIIPGGARKLRLMKINENASPEAHIVGGTPRIAIWRPGGRKKQWFWDAQIK